jgi:hypothetical protein
MTYIEHTSDRLNDIQMQLKYQVLPCSQQEKTDDSTDKAHKNTTLHLVCDNLLSAPFYTFASN